MYYAKTVVTTSWFDDLFQSDKVPQPDWGRLGLWVPRPHYAEKVYLSMTCKPSRSECLLFPMLLDRTRITAREAIQIIGDPKHVKDIKTQEDVANFVRVMAKFHLKLPSLLEFPPV